MGGKEELLAFLCSDGRAGVSEVQYRPALQAEHPASPSPQAHTALHLLRGMKASVRMVSEDSLCRLCWNLPTVTWAWN